MISQRQINNIALIGFMGTGKSTVGRLVAEQLHFEFLDTDEVIESRARKSIAAIFAEDGEPAFRLQEAALIAEMVSRARLVLSTGGGLGANPEHIASLKQHALVICLWASPDAIWERVRGQTHRPLLKEADPPAKIRQLLTLREPVYKQADVILNTEVRSLKEVAQLVLHHFHDARPRCR
jgi:shikimate kinase